MINKFNLGIVGVGNWGKNLLRSFSEQSTILLYFHNGDPKNEKWMNDHYPRVSRAESYESMLANPQIDAVVIATPLSTHTALAEKAIMSRKHVFIEKPISEKPNEVSHLVGLAHANNVSIFTGYIFLYNDVFYALKKELGEKKINYAKFEWSKWGTFRDHISFNLLSHDLAIAIDILGGVNIIRQEKKIGFITSSDIESFSAKFANGAEAEFTINRISPIKEKKVSFITDTDEYVWQGDSLLHIDKAGVSKIIYTTQKETLTEECRIFLETISDPKKSMRNCEVSILVTEALNKIRYLP